MNFRHSSKFLICAYLRRWTGPLVYHCGDVMMDAIASQISSLTIVYSTVYSDADQRKHQSFASLAFVWGIHRGPVNSPHKWPITRKMFPFDDVIMTEAIWPDFEIDILPYFHFLPRKCNWSYMHCSSHRGLFNDGLIHIRQADAGQMVSFRGSGGSDVRKLILLCKLITCIVWPRLISKITLKIMF